MRVAVVWNNDYSGVINRFGRSRPEEYRRVSVGSTVIETIVAALQDGGHATQLCEGDKGLFATLERFMPPDSQARPTGIVFNMAGGIQGEYRCTHVPAMLDMAGIPYTGSSPRGHGLTIDKVITKTLLRECGAPTPNFRVMRHGSESTGDLRFPVVVKPRHEYLSLGLQLVHEPTRLRQAVEAIVTQHAQDALVRIHRTSGSLYRSAGKRRTRSVPSGETRFRRSTRTSYHLGRQKAYRGFGATEDLSGASRK